MTETLARPLTTENRLLRAVGGPDLSVSLGSAMGAVFGGPTLGGLVAQQFQQAGAREGEFVPDQQSRIRAAEIERDQRINELNRSLLSAVDQDERQSVIAEIERAERDLDAVFSFETKQSVQDGRLQSKEALSEQYGELGLSFDRPMTKEEAEILADEKRAEIIRNALIEAGPRGVIPGVAKFAAGMAGMMTDPLELATMFIPVVGQAGKAAAIARFGTVGGRVAVGAAEGAVGQAITEPFYYALSRQAQLDYDMSDALLSVGVGLVFGGGVGAVAGAFARRTELRQTTAIPIDAPQVDVEAPPVRADMPAAEDPGDMFDRLVRETNQLAQQRAAGDLSLRQVINDHPVNVGQVMPAQGISDNIAALQRQLEAAQEFPLASAFRVRRGKADDKGRGGKGVGIDPDGWFGLELKSQGITPNTVPGLFRRGGLKDLDNLVASEWDETFPGLSSRTGVANGYLDRDGLLSAMVEELTGGSAGIGVQSRADIRGNIAELEAMQARIAEVKKLAAAEGFALRTDEEALFVANRMEGEGGLDAALERLAIMSEDQGLAMPPDPYADFEASRNADVKLPDTFMDDHIAELEAMAGQIEGADVELSAIRDLEARARAYAEIAEATAICLARTP